MSIFSIQDDDLRSIEELVERLVARYRSIEDPEFLREATVYAQELPRSIRAELNSFRLEESAGVLVIQGYRVDDESLGLTPSHWKDEEDRSAIAEKIFFFLCAALLGDPIGWATQQDGRIMHDIAPIKGHEKEQLGSGSEELLTWHTEDAFHPLRTDYLGLMCLRNPGSVPTTYASVDDLRLPEEMAMRLRECRYPIRPDRSHLPQNTSTERKFRSVERELLQNSYEWIMRLDEEPELSAVLFGDPASPYLRIDPYFMRDVYADDEAGLALDAITAEIDRILTEYVLRPGEILFVDNYKVVHGRSPFKARFDGTDRWLKRLNIVRDMRKSRSRRLAANGRVIY